MHSKEWRRIAARVGIGGLNAYDFQSGPREDTQCAVCTVIRFAAFREPVERVRDGGHGYGLRYASGVPHNDRQRAAPRRNI